ncbi:MAG: transporter substrate-binding domain-containing protein [Acidimicrobiales bacterium]
MSTTHHRTGTGNIIARSVAALVIGGGLLAACSSSTQASTKSSSPNLGTIKPGEMIVAIRSGDKPASYVSNGHAAGYQIDQLRAMAALMHLTPKFITVAFDSQVPGVQDERYDTTIGALDTPARAKVVGFTTPTDYVFAQLISRKSDPLATVNDAAGHSVAITAGSALIPLLQSKVPTVTVKEFPSIAASAVALETGQVQGLFTGPLTTKQLLSEHSDFTATQVIPIGYTALPFRKGDTVFGDALNKALATVMENGTFTRLFKEAEPGQKIPTQLLKLYPGMPQT